MFDNFAHQTSWALMRRQLKSQHSSEQIYLSFIQGTVLIKIFLLDLRIWCYSTLFIFCWFVLNFKIAAGMLWVDNERNGVQGAVQAQCSVCPVHLLPLHNLWTTEADHHGSVPQAAPGAIWGSSVNWMLLQLQGSFLPSSLRMREASPSSYLWAQQGPASACKSYGGALCQTFARLSFILLPLPLLLRFFF